MYAYCNAMFSSIEVGAMGLAPLGDNDNHLQPGIVDDASKNLSLTVNSYSTLSYIVTQTLRH
jgi:hypothetical protein